MESLDSRTRRLDSTSLTVKVDIQPLDITQEGD
jgi:hypothetical protein